MKTVYKFWRLPIRKQYHRALTLLENGLATSAVRWLWCSPVSWILMTYVSQNAMYIM